MEGGIQTYTDTCISIAPQGRNHQIWSDQVGVCMQERYTLGGPGGMLPQKKV